MSGYGEAAARRDLEAFFAQIERPRGVHLCGLAAPLEPAAGEDIEAFARELAERSGGGLGWS
jgi:hypothetical protein